jgi:hypothetical protein
LMPVSSLATLEATEIHGSTKTTCSA